MTTDLLHIQSAGMEFSDPASQKAHDLEIILKRKAHVVGMTEVDSAAFRAQVMEACREYNYRALILKSPEGAYSTTPILVHRSIPITSWRFDRVIPAGSDRFGKWGPRGVTTVRGKWNGSYVSFSWAHWLTRWDTQSRYQANMRLTDALIYRVRTDGNKHKLAFWGGDMNWDQDDPTPDHPGLHMRRHGLYTIFDDMKKPDLATSGRRTIQLIGRFRPDLRVEPKRLVVHTDAIVPTFTNHSQVSAYYEIERP